MHFLLLSNQTSRYMLGPICSQHKPIRIAFKYYARLIEAGIVAIFRRKTETTALPSFSAIFGLQSTHKLSPEENQQNRPVIVVKYR